MIYFQKENIKRWLIGAGIIIVAVVLGVIIFRAMFVKEKISDTVDAGEQALIEIKGESAIRMKVRSKVVSDENFRYYEVTLKPQTREIKVFSGYNGELVATKSYENNWDAYTEVSYGLKRLDMMKGRAFVGDKDDTRGICPSGELVTFEVLDGERVIKKLWRTSCKGEIKSLKGDYKAISQLILTQIPNYKDTLKEAGF